MLKKYFLNFHKYLFRAFFTVFSKAGHVTRYYMYNHISEYHHEKRDKYLRVLSISGSEKLCRVLGFDASSIIDASYPESNILHLAFEDESFHVVISNQVLEHIERNPQDAINETLRVLKPDGLLVHAL